MRACPQTSWSSLAALRRLSLNVDAGNALPPEWSALTSLRALRLYGGGGQGEKSAAERQPRNILGMQASSESGGRMRGALETEG